jgi:hypothetical protein
MSTSSPARRLAYADQTTEELEKRVNVVAAEMIELQARYEKMQAERDRGITELQERGADAHRAALHSLACPACANSDLTHMRYGDACGYEWHRLERGAKDSDLLRALESQSGANYVKSAFVRGEGGLAAEVEICNVGKCLLCQARWVWPSPLTVTHL